MGDRWMKDSRRDRREIASADDLLEDLEDFNADRLAVAPTFDDVEAVGLDGTGRNGDSRFPYSWDDVRAARAEISRLRGMGLDDDMIMSNMRDPRFRYAGHPLRVVLTDA